MTMLWKAHRPAVPKSLELGEQLGKPFTAPTRERAELLAIARYGRPVVVVRLLRSSKLEVMR